MGHKVLSKKNEKREGGKKTGTGPPRRRINKALNSREQRTYLAGKVEELAPSLTKKKNPKKTRRKSTSHRNAIKPPGEKEPEK